MSYIRNSSEDLVWNTNTNQYEPARSSEDKYIPAEIVTISNTTYQNNTDIVSVDLQNTSFVNDSMYHAFYNCTSLETVTNINSNITNLEGAFYNCQNLTGNIYIYSEVVNNAIDCFTELSGIHKTKYVYIPFKNSNDNNYTTTYNSFISAGYDTNGTKDDVYLRGIDLIEYVYRYYDSNIKSYVELYLYEFDESDGKHYYTFENNTYTDVTEQVQINEEVSCAFMPKYYGHRSSISQPWTREYYWMQSQFYYTVPSTTSDFAGYPYKFDDNSDFNVYIQNITSFGLTKYYNGKKVAVGEDTSGYINTYPYVLTGPEASSTSTKVRDYIYDYIAITRVHNRSLVYNSNRYFIYKLDRNINKTYLAYTGEDTGTVFYCSNLTYSSADRNLHFANRVSLNSREFGIYDTLDNCIYAYYNNGGSYDINAYIFEKAIRTPSLDTDILPPEIND